MADAPSPTIPPLRTVILHVLLPVLMGAIMTAAYLGGFHKPDPHHLPVAVVGDAQHAGPVAAAVQQGVGDVADVTTVPDRKSAEEKIKHLEIAGAYVPAGETGGDAGSDSGGDSKAASSQGEATLLVATAASDTTANVVEKIFRQVSDKADVRLQVDDVVPVGTEDPAGQNGFFFLVALSVGAYAAAIAIGAAGARRRFPDRIALAVGTAVVISTAYLAIAGWGFGLFPGHLWAAWGLSLLYTTAVICVGVGLHPLVGRFCTLAYSAAFVAFNFTSSGGVFAPALQPALYGWLHQFWIGSGFVEAMRRVTDFPEASLAAPIWTLLGWLVFGAVCLGIGYAVERSRAAADARVETQVRARVEDVVRAQHGRRAADRPSDYRGRELTAAEAELEEELEENVAV